MKDFNDFIIPCDWVARQNGLGDIFDTINCVDNGSRNFSFEF